MLDRCELCGAKLRDDDRSCRECGTELPEAPAGSKAARDVTAVESSPGADEGPLPAETNPELTLEAAPGRRGPLIALLTVAAVATAGAFTYHRMSSDDAAREPARAVEAPAAPIAAQPEAAACDAVASLGGRWTFTTEVAGARVVQSSGLNGFYELEVEVLGCTANATLTKTGYTARTFNEARVQRGTATLELDDAGFATAAFDLESSLGPHGTTEFSFIAKGSHLSGVYRQRGDRWQDGGLFGFLRGVREEGEAQRELVAAQEPCLTRCHLACGAAVRDVAAQDLDTCVEVCAEDANTPARCGDAQDLPEAYDLSLNGPAKLSTLCKAIGGCARKLSRAPSLGAERLPEGWSEVKMVRGRTDGSPRLALHRENGWFLSAPLFEAGVDARLGTLRLYARQLSEPRRRYVLGLARIDPTPESDEAYIACRLDDVPRCARVVRARSSLANALPEGNLSVAAGAAEPTGVFTW